MRGATWVSGFEWVADDEPPGHGDEPFHERLVDGSLDQQARPGDAGLTARREDAEDNAGDRDIRVCIGKDDGRRFAAELQRHRHELVGCLARDAAAHRGSAGERHLADRGMRDEEIATMEPAPGSVENSPFGRPASSMMRASSSDTSGLQEAGLSSTALPAASAGAIFCASLAIGEFHGVIAATTPIGSCAEMVR